MSTSQRRIFVAGHRGMVGSAIVRQLENQADCQIIVRSRAELDLTDQHAVERFFATEAIDEVYLAAAKVGGILANNELPADFIYINLMIQGNVIHAAHSADVQKLLFLGSSCIYPKLAPQPMAETTLLEGKLEPTNEPYAIAKIAGIKLCESYNRQYGRDYRSVLPTNLYGPGDNFHPQHSHVIPGLIRRFDEAVRSNAPTIEIWGTGKPRREFLYVDDMANACVFVMNQDRAAIDAVTEPMLSHLNVGTGTDCTIAELVDELVAISGYRGKVVYDTSKPDGTPRKLLDTRRLKSLGWQYQVDLSMGLRLSWDWYQRHRQ